MRQLTTWAIASVLSTSICGMSLANPADPVRTTGAVTFAQPSPDELVVTQSGGRALIEWRSFDIAANETTRFLQPSASSIIVNKVVGGGGRSELLGLLEANGIVMLLNPAGVLFGPDSVVDTAGLVATSASFNDSEFDAALEQAIENFPESAFAFDLPGRSDAKVVNDGLISISDAGISALVAPHVENNGTIIAEAGRVILAGAEAFTIDLYGDGMLTIDAGSTLTAGAASLVSQGEHGRIAADGGRVLITAEDASGLLDQVINLDGVVQARSANRIGDGGGSIALVSATPADAAASSRVRVSADLEAGSSSDGRNAIEVVAAGDVVVDGSLRTSDGNVLVKSEQGRVEMTAQDSNGEESSGLIGTGQGAIEISAGRGIGVADLASTKSIKLRSVTGDIVLHRDLAGEGDREPEGIGRLMIEAPDGDVYMKGVLANEGVETATGRTWVLGNIESAGPVHLSRAPLGGTGGETVLRANIRTDNEDVSFGGKLYVAPFSGAAGETATTTIPGPDCIGTDRCGELTDGQFEVDEFGASLFQFNDFSEEFFAAVDLDVRTNRLTVSSGPGSGSLEFGGVVVGGGSLPEGIEEARSDSSPNQRIDDRGRFVSEFVQLDVDAGLGTVVFRNGVGDFGENPLSTLGGIDWEAIHTIGLRIVSAGSVSGDRIIVHDFKDPGGPLLSVDDLRQGAQIDGLTFLDLSKVQDLKEPGAELAQVMLVPARRQNLPATPDVDSQGNLAFDATTRALRNADDRGDTGLNADNAPNITPAVETVTSPTPLPSWPDVIPPDPVGAVDVTAVRFAVPPPPNVDVVTPGRPESELGTEDSRFSSEQEEQEDDKQSSEGPCAGQEGKVASKTSPAAAAFGSDRLSNAYSVDPLCARYRLVDRVLTGADSAATKREEDFWSLDSRVPQRPR